MKDVSGFFRVRWGVDESYGKPLNACSVRFLLFVQPFTTTPNEQCPNLVTSISLTYRLTPHACLLPPLCDKKQFPFLVIALSLVWRFVELGFLHVAQLIELSACCNQAADAVQIQQLQAIVNQMMYDFSIFANFKRIYEACSAV